MKVEVCVRGGVMLGMMLALGLDSEGTLCARVEAEMRWIIHQFYEDAEVTIDWTGGGVLWDTGCWLAAYVTESDPNKIVDEALAPESQMLAELLRRVVLDKA